MHSNRAAVFARQSKQSSIQTFNELFWNLMGLAISLFSLVCTNTRTKAALVRKKNRNNFEQSAPPITRRNARTSARTPLHGHMNLVSRKCTKNVVCEPRFVHGCHVEAPIDWASTMLCELKPGSNWRVSICDFVFIKLDNNFLFWGFVLVLALGWNMHRLWGAHETEQKSHIFGLSFFLTNSKLSWFRACFVSYVLFLPSLRCFV